MCSVDEIKIVVFVEQSKAKPFTRSLAFRHKKFDQEKTQTLLMLGVQDVETKGVPAKYTQPKTTNDKDFWGIESVELLENTGAVDSTLIDSIMQTTGLLEELGPAAPSYRKGATTTSSILRC